MDRSKKADKKKRIKKVALILAIVFVLISFYIVHCTFVAESTVKGDLITIMNGGFTHMFTSPFSIVPFPKNAILNVLMFFALIAVVFFFVYQKQKLRRHDDLSTVAGDAKWMDDKELEQYNTEFTEPIGSPKIEGYQNAILSNDIYLSMNAAKTGRNLNMFVIGGSGTGKSFRIVGPNILQRNCSMVITDPSGGLYKQYGSYLEYYGYKVKTFNLDRMENSNHYNPFNYIETDKDIEILVTMIIANTTSEDSKGDKFWENCEIALLCALIAYLLHYCPPEERTFTNVKELIRAANIDENDSSMQSKLDIVFEELRKKEPDCFAIAQYDTFRLAAGKTLKSVLISVGVRLQAFDLQDIRTLTDTDDIELDKVADEKTAIFIIVPTGEKTFNFIAGLMYSQLFSRLYRYCETTAEFGYALVDAKGELVKAFRANSGEDSENARKEAEEFLKLCDTAKVVKNEEFSEVSGKDKREFWEIRNGDTLLGFRGTSGLAKEALSNMRSGKIVPTHDLGNHGQRCPIHVRFLLDEFANTGKIPDFCEKISTIRKYEISTTIILQSLKQITNLYEKEWDIITGNCDSTIYLGGGNDRETTKWFSELLGKKTVVTMSTSMSNNGGSDSFSRSGVELYSMSQLRTMPNGECIVLLRTKNPFKGDMYDTPHHPEWALLNSFPPYIFNAKKHSYLRQQMSNSLITQKASGAGVMGGVIDNIPEESKEDAAYRNEINKTASQNAGDIKFNQSIDNETKISDITYIDLLDISAVSESVIDDILVDETTDAPNDTSNKSNSVNIDDMILSFNFNEEEMCFSGAPQVNN